MCCLLLVIILPVVVTCILYDLLWWLWSPFPTIMLWVHGPPSSCWTATVDPMGIYAKTCEVSLFGSFLSCLCVRFLWCSSSLSTLIGFLSSTGIILHTRWLNSQCFWFVVTPCVHHHQSLSNFYSVLNEFYTGFYSSITLVMVWWWHCLLDVENAAETSEFLWNRIAASTWHYPMQYTLFCKYGFYCCDVISKRTGWSTTL